MRFSRGPFLRLQEYGRYLLSNCGPFLAEPNATVSHFLHTSSLYPGPSCLFFQTFNVSQQLQSSVVWLHQPVILIRPLYYLFTKTISKEFNSFTKNLPLSFHFSFNHWYLTHISSHIAFIVQDEYMQFQKYLSFNPYSTSSTTENTCVCAPVRSRHVQHASKQSGISSYFAALYANQM